ncbi:electron transfer flavoprotein subunit beta/FixA family protein [Membranihabitans marinus]|uniref:electron transfer flavoprotein subunit beta/FixA family protein n=1 Tax=Membranihabitans marinus TaxID=1227546 RepID=UPI001F3CB5EB|nr:electron transfer flavoprotein subunit beta/FixA family protein [Membranihabitans marinus]
MNILVCIAKSIETTAKIVFTPDNSALDESGMQYIMNPYDEWYSLVRALELKDQVGGEVTVIHVGDASSDPIIRKALAIGADKGVRIDTIPQSAADVAKQLSAYLADKSFDIVFTGKETVDYNGGILPAMLAAKLKWPFFDVVSHLEYADDLALISKEIEGGVKVFKSPLPLVLSATKGLAEQKIPNMRGIMMAKRKPLEVVSAVDHATDTNIVSFSKPEKSKEVTLVDADDMDELVRLLHEEAKVI